jgi:N-dimethylarginine dimethylaminohydrolase
MSDKINSKVLVSGAKFFADTYAINAYMDSSVAVDVTVACEEHDRLKSFFESAGIEVISVEPPANCQDGVYTANWGLCRGNKVITSSLPNIRQLEEPYAYSVLDKLGFTIIKSPYRFSGQGDALPCGNILFCGSNYRTDSRMHSFISDTLGYEVIGLQTIPKTDSEGKEVINTVTGWSDSFFYDIDLAIAVLTDNLIAWCPEAFMPESQEKIRNLGLDKIEVSIDEATKGFGCNLISTGQTVVMSSHAPLLQKAINDKGLMTITPNIVELSKGGGFIRCTTLTLDNA